VTGSLVSVVASGAVAVGLAIATAVVLRSGGPGEPAAPVSAAAVTAPPTSAAGLYDQGRVFFQARGCIGCHSVSDKGLVSRMPMAPDLSGLAQRAASRRPGLAAEEYVKESVRQPQAYIVPGFTDIQMPTLPVSDADLQAITAFLLAPAPRP
jgi:cytochrome c oxidase subunit II